MIGAPSRIRRATSSANAEKTARNTTSRIRCVDFVLPIPRRFYRPDQELRGPEMYVGALPPISTRAGWTFVREVVDDDTDEAIDLSDASIVFEVRSQRDGTTVLSATTGNGKITIADTGVFQVEFAAAEMT